MKKHSWLSQVAVTCAMTLLWGTGARPQASSAASGPSVTRDHEEDKRRQAGRGLNEGVKVRGAWTIVIRNADGTVASRHEFDNALVSSGRTVLTGYLHGTFQPRWWRIEVWGTNAPAMLCRNTAGTQSACWIILANQPPTTTAQVPFPTLTKTVINSKFVLQGSFKAAFTGDIASVWTSTAEGTPASSVAPSFLQFTQHQVPNAIPVSANQTVDITVEISFS